MSNYKNEIDHFDEGMFQAKHCGQGAILNYDSIVIHFPSREQKSITSAKGPVSPSAKNLSISESNEENRVAYIVVF